MNEVEAFIVFHGKCYLGNCDGNATTQNKTW